MSNIYNYRFRGQNETPMQANMEEKQEPQKDMVKDLLNSL